MVARLVAVCILTYQTGNVSRSMFTHRVVIGEKMVQSFDERLVASEKSNQAIDILRHKEGILPTISFAEVRTTAFVYRACWVIRCSPRTVSQLWTDIIDGLVEIMLVKLGS